MTQLATTTQTESVKDLLNRESVKKKFAEMLGEKSNQFLTSVLQIVASNDLLKNADPLSIYNAATLAATLDLPLNNSLGFAYIVPYNQKQKDGSYKQVAQFQIGYKGFIQLAQRSGQFRTISAAPIFEGQLIEQNPLTGFVFDFTKKTSDKVIGFASHFELLNGFQKTFFMTAAELEAHGKSFSQTFKKGYGLWKDNFDSMATKTVLKLLLSKYAPLSIAMQQAVITDQAVIKNETATSLEYADHEVLSVDKEAERVYLLLDQCEDLEVLETFKKHCTTPELIDKYENKKSYLQQEKK